MYDTSALIQRIRKGADYGEGSISVITLIEILRGIEDEEKREKTMSLLEESFEILDVNRSVGLSYVKLCFELKKKRTPASVADQLIAATALANDQVLLTSDRAFLMFQPSVKVKLLTP